jgi:hypothetical protein
MASKGGFPLALPSGTKTLLLLIGELECGEGAEVIGSAGIATGSRAAG